MSGLPEEQYARNVLRAGASGYLSKGGSPEELLKAVRLVLNGRRYVSASLAEAMAGDLESKHDPNKPLHAELSAREFQQFLQARRWSGCGRDRPGAELERQDSQHLPNPDIGKNELQVERGHHRRNVRCATASFNRARRQAPHSRAASALSSTL